MGVRLLLLFVIYQTVITVSLGGVTLPFSDSIGKVTPIKPKPLTESAVSSSITSSSSLVCDIKDAPPAAKGSVIKGFSSPLEFTSSSRALPVPKIDSPSIENVKMPERFRKKFLALYKDAVRNATQNSLSPKVSLPCKYPLLSSPSKLPSDIPTYAPLYINKLRPLPIIKSLPNVPVESFKTSGIDFSSSISKTNQFSVPIGIALSPRSRNIHSPSTLEARKSPLPEQFTANTFFPLSSSYSSPYPLHYKSIYLPSVKTPERLNYRPFFYKGANHFNLPNQSSSHNLLTLTSDTSLNALPHRIEPYESPFLNSIKTSQIVKPMNPIRLPKTLSNLPITSKTVTPPLHLSTSAPNAVTENLWLSKEANPAASVPLVLPSTNLRGDQNHFSSMPNLWTDKTTDFKLKPCTPPVIKPPTYTSPKTFLNSPAVPSVPKSPSSPNIDALSNRRSSFDCSGSFNTPNMLPIIGVCTETIENINPNDLNNYYQTCCDSQYVPSLDGINVVSTTSLQHPLITKECVSIPLQYSPPTIPTEPIATIFPRTSNLSPISGFPSKISQTPTTTVSYINQSPYSSISQSTSNMVSSINKLVSNITQKILSSYKSYIHSALQNIPQTPTYTIQSNPYADAVLKPEETHLVASILPFPQENPVSTISTLPFNSALIDLPAVETSTILLSDIPCKSSAFEISSGQPSLISSPQPTARVSSPASSPTSLITFSSPQLCPSYLPSPSLPSYATIASPLYIEAPVFKVKSSKKESDVEKMVELMLLAEILNNDENFDWDDLDTLLAFLSLT